ELNAAGLLPDPEANKGAVGRTQCLSCSRPLTVASDVSRFSSHMQVAGARMSTAPGAPTRPPHNLHVHQPPVVWRGGFRMPPKRLPLQQHQHQQHQPQFFSYAGSVTGASPGGRVDGVAYDSRRNDGGSHVSPATPLPNDIQNLADVKASEAPDGQDTRVLS
ncbi:unnamed protein product, partial [Sphacelaria rigidula]